MLIVNPDIKPWNYFGSHTDPSLSAHSNVIIDGKEWFNSFMPPFFATDSAVLVAELLDKTNKTALREYQTYIDDLFKIANWPKIIAEIYERLDDYFKFEAQFLDDDINKVDLETLLSQWLYSFNISQYSLDSIEPLATAKNSKLNPFFKLFTIEEYWQKLEGLPSIETPVIPLAVLTSLGKFQKNKKVYLVAKHVADKLLCDMDLLWLSLARAEEKFKYSRFMSIADAKSIILKEANKLSKNIKLNGLTKVAFDLGNLNALITWSKYILLSKDSPYFRYDSMFFLNRKLLNLPEIKRKFPKLGKMETTSGSEIYGKGIYVAQYLLHSDKKLKARVQNRAEML